MPTVIDETVAPVAYDTSGNGGRKVARYSDGTTENIITVVKNGTTEIRLYKKVGSNASVLLANFAVTTLTDVCIENVGNGYIGILYSHSGTTVSYRTVKVSDGTLGTIVNADSGQSAVGNVTMIANDAKTELSISASTKNATNSTSFNVRFTKGPIATDGSVVWGAVTQVSSINTSGYDFINSSITLNGLGKAVIVVEYGGSSNTAKAIGIFTNANTTKSWITVLDANWGSVVIYTGSSYAHSSPSAIFVPQSVNGLTNGRIWVAWHGYDATDNNAYNIRVSFSDDGGVTWSAMQKLTSGNIGNQTYPSLTGNRSNKIFVLFNNGSSTDTTTIVQVCKITHDGSSWSAKTNVTNITAVNYANAPNPSTLFDLSVSFTEPLLIYRNSQTSKVGFYGTWTVTTISVTQGSIGQKTDKANLLTYAITTDGTMSTITEKVNGVTIGTKTATSGQSLIAGLTQAQWDAVKFGKYKDATGGANTLTVTMGSEVFTYTFDKRLATDADVLSAVKAMQDADSVYLPSVKSKLVAKVGGVTTDSFETIINGVQLGKKFASGTFTYVSGGTIAFQDNSGVAQSLTPMQINGLSFIPSVIVVYNDYFPVIFVNTKELKASGYTLIRVENQYIRLASNANSYINLGSIQLPMGGTGTRHWEAYE